MTTRLLAWVSLALAGSASLASGTGIQPFSDETAFQQAVAPVTTESFNRFPTGTSVETTLQLGNVQVVLTAAGAALIFGPGTFGFGFTSNFLSTGVQDDGNNVVITFPPGTRGAGMKLVSVLPVTVKPLSGSGESMSVEFTGSQVSFLGFVADSGITQIRISSLPGPKIPIVNIGDISYGGPPNATPTPTATPVPVPGDPNCGQVGFLGCPTSARTAALTTADCLLNDGSYYDVFQFSGTQGQTVTISMSSASFDTFVFLLDPSGNKAAFDDDSGGGTNSRLTFTLNSTGSWSILANSFDANQFGSYTLALTCSGGIGNTATPLSGVAPTDIPMISFRAMVLLGIALAAGALAMMRRSSV